VVTKAQALVYQLLADVTIKSLIGLAAIIAFGVVLYFFIKDPGYEQVAMTGVIGWVIRQVFAHHHPTQAKSPDKSS
jgi:hypothetical protein